MLIAPAFLRLDAVLNVDNKGRYRRAPAFAGLWRRGCACLDALRYGFLCIIRAERFQTGKAFLPGARQDMYLQGFISHSPRSSRRKSAKSDACGISASTAIFSLPFQLVPVFFRLVLRIALSLAAPAGDNDGQAVFPAQPVADVAYAVIAPLVGIVLVVVYEIDRAENNVVMDMPLVYVGSQTYSYYCPFVTASASCRPISVRLFIADFPRLKGLHKVVG